ncbi:MAG TPA: HAMP domain-containing sensor histidine kinase [Clostridia bacterium]|nr:HAMP domain-containing sensor histidine kinase [Clostridia bacterium]
MQDKIFKKLRSRFILACVATAGAFLLIVFVVVFGIVYSNTQNQIYSTINNALYGKNEPDFQGKNDYIKYSIKEDGFSMAMGSDRYDAELFSEILDKAVEIKNGEFSAGGYLFIVDSAESVDMFGQSTTTYIIYDATILSDSLLTLGLTLTISYIASIGLITLIAFLFSKSAVRPVEEAFIKQKELVANASHELKTPLTIISTNLSVVKSNGSKTVKQNEKWLDNIDLYVNRMDSLILDMLELSKLENTELNKETFDISQLVNRAALSMDAACFEKNINLNSDISPNLMFFSNAKQIERLTLILLDNAVKYTNQGGNIDIKLTATNKKISLAVKNTGEGIPKEKLDKIFDRFYRTNSARTSDETHSFGLGLAIAKAITNNLGGKITVESEEKQYTLFTVTFNI